MAACIVPIYFAGDGIEFLETAAIAYALGKSGYRREAVIGSVCGLILVTLPAFFVWPLFRLIPVHLFQLVIGVMLLGLGSFWVIKSLRRKRLHQQAGWIEHPLRRYKGHIESTHSAFSYWNAAIMTKSAAVEGFEVCLIVIGLAITSSTWSSALTGAALALITTLGLVALLHGRLQKIPEVALKFWAGVILSLVGFLWIFEGISKLMSCA